MSKNESELQREETKQVIEKWEKRAFVLKVAMCIVVFILAALIFASMLYLVKLQFIASEDINYQKVAEITNTFVGIVLGFVAMTVSLIGMVLSFYNTIQAEKSNVEFLKQSMQNEYSMRNANDTLNSFSGQTAEILERLEGFSFVIDGIRQDINDVKSRVRDAVSVQETPQTDKKAKDADLDDTPVKE